jgi:MoxR-like ATPase
MDINPTTHKKRLDAGRLMMSSIIVGNDHAIHLAICCMLIGRGFITTSDPGLGKTALALALQKFLRGATSHVLECTPQMKPSDIYGQVIRDIDGNRKVDLGMAMKVNILLADEINRATEDTQAGFLRLTDNQGATLDDRFYELPTPNFFLATRNYQTDPGARPMLGPLLNRMAAETEMKLPPRDDMKRLVRNTDVHRGIFKVEPCLELEEVQLLRNYITHMVESIPEPVLDYICNLVIALNTRSPEEFNKLDFVPAEPKGSKTLRKLRFGQRRLTADELKQLPFTEIRKLEVLARGISGRSLIWICHLAAAMAFLDGRDKIDFSDIEQAWCAQTHQLLMRPVARSYGIEPMHILTTALDSVDY